MSSAEQANVLGRRRPTERERHDVVKLQPPALLTAPAIWRDETATFPVARQHTSLDDARDVPRPHAWTMARCRRAPDCLQRST